MNAALVLTGLDRVRLMTTEPTGPTAEGKEDAAHCEEQKLDLNT